MCRIAFKLLYGWGMRSLHLGQILMTSCGFVFVVICLFCIVFVTGFLHPVSAFQKTSDIKNKMHLTQGKALEYQGEMSEH